MITTLDNLLWEEIKQLAISSHEISTRYRNHLLEYLSSSEPFHDDKFWSLVNQIKDHIDQEAYQRRRKDRDTVRVGVQNFFNEVWQRDKEELISLSGLIASWTLVEDALRPIIEAIFKDQKSEDKIDDILDALPLGGENLTKRLLREEVKTVEDFSSLLNEETDYFGIIISGECYCLLKLEENYANYLCLALCTKQDRDQHEVD
jgi:hypothetical protein